MLRKCLRFSGLRFFGPKFLLLACALTALAASAADEPVVLKNTGEPIKVPYLCAEEELQAVGLLCTEQEPCAVFLELSSISPVGRKIYLAGDIHATSGTITSILLGSDDGGLTWREPSPRIRMSGLGQSQFYDLEHGWVVGESQYPLPHDPFFLVTSDGGATWRNRPLAEDGGPGAVAKFWFDSHTHGEMILDAGKSAPSGRYISYESETSGESWMIRATSDRLPKIARAPAILENENFRLKSDSKRNVYDVQKRNGDRWETTASFAIDVASCKAKAQEFKDEPVVDPATAVNDIGPGDKDYVEEIRLGGPAPLKKPSKKPLPATPASGKDKKN